MHPLTRTLAAVLALAVAVPAHGQVKEDVLKKIETALPDRPVAPPKAPRKILVYSKTLGFRHGSIPTGAAAIKALGEKTGAFTAEHSEDPAMFDENRLSAFDAVLFLNTTGDCLAPGKDKLTEEQQATLEQRKKNLLNFVAGGKGFAGIHSATDTFYSWKEYGDMIGAWFTSHPWGAVPLKVDSQNHPLTAMFDQNGFDIKDEIYMFGPQSSAGKFDRYQPYAREKLRVLLSVDMSKFEARGGTRPDNDYAISWIKPYEKGRVFYCALGHGEAMYMNPLILKHYLAGLQFVLGDLPADATPGVK